MDECECRYLENWDILFYRESSERGGALLWSYHGETVALKAVTLNRGLSLLLLLLLFPSFFIQTLRTNEERGTERNRVSYYWNYGRDPDARKSKFAVSSTVAALLRFIADKTPRFSLVKETRRQRPTPLLLRDSRAAISRLQQGKQVWR